MKLPIEIDLNPDKIMVLQYQADLRNVPLPTFIEHLLSAWADVRTVPLLHRNNPKEVWDAPTQDQPEE